MDWHLTKEWLSATTHLDMDALHVHAGVLLQIAVALLLRKRLSSPWPWLAVLAVTLANEIYDYRYEVWPNRGDQRAESLRDLWNTLLLPSVILVIARYLPSLFSAQAREAEPLGDVSAADAGEAGAACCEARQGSQ
ncbi:hypothetical protein E2493_01300 [Sphingomonas parva]|uniref:Uncharacterized protein n=1 Tax=Sphingomonas parva TaxID=2555898 RepID=A0A4Y8ZWR9_9SPHN|nr:hypothetical protein [Sphingomonas parva]TFI59917.1 hypothetical protein E2493_01300 [Sphingomonas parva]